MSRPRKPSTLLRRMSACDEAVEWAKPYATLQEAWDACERPDWMLWLCERTKTHRDECVRLAFAFADRAVRVDAVAALRSAGLTEHADRLAVLPVIDSADSARAASDSARAARDAARAARDAARAASYAAGAARYAAGAASDSARAASDAAGAARYAAWAASDAARAASDAAGAANYAAGAARYAAWAASDAAGAARYAAWAASDAANADLVRREIPSVAAMLAVIERAS